MLLLAAGAAAAFFLIKKEDPAPVQQIAPAEQDPDSTPPILSTRDAQYNRLSAWASGVANPGYMALLNSLDPTGISIMYLLVFTIWNSNGSIDPYKYFLDQAHTITAGQWWENIAPKFGVG